MRGYWDVYLLLQLARIHNWKKLSGILKINSLSIKL